MVVNPHAPTGHSSTQDQAPKVHLTKDAHAAGSPAKQFIQMLTMTEAMLSKCSLTAAARDSTSITDHTGEKEASQLVFHRVPRGGVQALLLVSNAEAVGGFAISQLWSGKVRTCTMLDLDEANMLSKSRLTWPTSNHEDVG
ncbi:hypothetical protein GRJ2_003315200 [Grus japonensis]|uniref:Uncharacterized protein n=1 Tax=Grus japonensis TaxID=30415 RepID=A0ABC9YEK0_GRUJA